MATLVKSHPIQPEVQNVLFVSSLLVRLLLEHEGGLSFKQGFSVFKKIRFILFYTRVFRQRIWHVYIHICRRLQVLWNWL